MDSSNLINKKKKMKKKSRKAKRALQRESIGDLDITEFIPNDYFRSEALLSMWWKSYLEAFEREHEWMEARGQRTSRRMGLTAAQMMPLVFNDEHGTVMRRVCFVATMKTNDEVDGQVEGVDESITESVCCYATVDENPDSTGVCHLRMLVVPPSFQKRGIGLTMLQSIVNSERFQNRHMGLKYAKCNDYEHFYSKVGFQKIGCDELYVYMAIRR